MLARSHSDLYFDTDLDHNIEWIWKQNTLLYELTCLFSCFLYFSERRDVIIQVSTFICSTVPHAHA